MILTLDKNDWAAAEGCNRDEVSEKGLAIDHYVKSRLAGLEVGKYAPFDMCWESEHDVLGLNIPYHEVKSYSVKTISISPAEVDFAGQMNAQHAEDVLYWIFKQLPSRNDFVFKGLARFSEFRYRLNESKFSQNYKTRDTWKYGKGQFMFINDMEQFLFHPDNIETLLRRTT